MCPRAGRMAIASQDRPGHDPIDLLKRTESGQDGRPFGVARWSWPKASHSGSNLDSNIVHFKKKLLMWHVVNEKW